MITRELLRQWHACYSDERIAELVPVEGLTPLQVCDLDIPVDDKFWVLLREEIIPLRQLREFACDVAEEPCRMRGVTDARSYAAIETARRYARGEATDTELAAAWDAARAAARAAAWADASDAEQARQLAKVRSILEAL
jgi:hypothetical protein